MWIESLYIGKKEIFPIIFATNFNSVICDFSINKLN